MLTTEQLQARKSGIGGSDMAAIMGLSPWKTAAEVYYEKRGEMIEEDIGEKEVVIFGNLLEDVVAGEYARRNNVKVERRNDMFRHKNHPFMLANIDRKVVGVRKGLECKTGDKYTTKNWGEAGTDEVPEYYYIQGAHYMEVMGYNEWDFAVVLGGNDYRDYHIERDPELGELIIESAATFWDGVQNGIPPEIDFEHSSTPDMLKRLYPGTTGKTIELNENLEAWHQVKLDADAEVKRYSAVSEAAKNRILAAIGDNACGILPRLGTQYKRSETKRKEFTVEANTFMVMRNSKYTEGK
jgi:putative phage-type endonuclease